jgi:uncharacterized membrane protein YeaQ/YmgE (transglycosylase-associated protein family)
MSVLMWIVFGLIVGIVAKFLMPGRDPRGFIFTIVLGIVGALIGGFLGRIMGLYREGDSVGFVMAVMGALVLLGIYRFIGGRPRRV